MSPWGFQRDDNMKMTFHIRRKESFRWTLLFRKMLRKSLLRINVFCSFEDINLFFIENDRKLDKYWLKYVKLWQFRQKKFLYELDFRRFDFNDFALAPTCSILLDYWKAPHYDDGNYLWSMNYWIDLNEIEHIFFIFILFWKLFLRFYLNWHSNTWTNRQVE